MSRQPTGEYYALKDRARNRALAVCEFCNWRFGSVLHHRWYDADYYTGAEPMESVMFVCPQCHAAIHGHTPWRDGKQPSMTVRTGSLAHQGDTGQGRSDAWSAYLNSREPFKEPHLVVNNEPHPDPRYIFVNDLRGRR